MAYQNIYFRHFYLKKKKTLRDILLIKCRALSLWPLSKMLCLLSCSRSAERWNDVKKVQKWRIMQISYFCPYTYNYVMWKDGKKWAFFAILSICGAIFHLLDHDGAHGSSALTLLGLNGSTIFPKMYTIISDGYKLVLAAEIHVLSPLEKRVL